MRTGTLEKNIDKTKINIGAELEALMVNRDTLQTVSIKESGDIFRSLINDFGWKEVQRDLSNKLYKVSKEIAGYLTEIHLDSSYALFEISTPTPFSSLKEMRKTHREVIKDVRNAGHNNNAMIWPFGVPPASMNLFNLPFQTREELVGDPLYIPLRRFDYQARFCHLSSHQVNIDVPLKKMILSMNALYKNSGEILETFARTPLKYGDTFYKEGRYYWWKDLDIVKDGVATRNPAQYDYGANPVFPPHEFNNFQGFYEWTWQGQFCFVVRDGHSHTFVDNTMSPERFFKQKKGVVLTPDEEEIEIEINTDDIELQFISNWLDFKPHFDFKQFTVAEFFDFYQKNDIDGFLEEFCEHSYLEIRCCSPHWEDDAMVLPTYFYKIFENLDEYIKKSEQIDWEDARKARNEAIAEGYTE